MIQLKNVQKSYPVGGGSLPVLKGIDLTINEGEMVSIMGSSGSGKSTLLNILGILDDFDSGEYYLDGKLIDHISEKHAAFLRNSFIGFVFQSFNLIPFKNALENVAKAINLIADAFKGLKALGAGALDLLDLGMGVGERFGPAGTDTTPLFNNTKAGGGTSRNVGGTTIIMNGVVDGESGRRSIERLLQNSSKRTGIVNLAGSAL